MDAYTLRKIAPRILIGVIGINLSIYLCVAAIDITEVIGRGIGDLLRAPFIDANSFTGGSNGIGIEANTENTVVGIVGVGAIGALVGTIFASLATGAGGAVVVSILGLLLPLIVTVSLVAVAVLITVVIRYGLLIFLSVISPVAIACFILPGTEKYFRQWWDLFIKALLVYPLIAVFFALSDILAAIFLKQAGDGGDGIGLVFLFVTVVAIIAPLVLIPFAFKFAGGVLAQAMNVAEGRARGISNMAGERIRKTREDPSSFLGKNATATQSWRAQRGLTGRGMWAKRPGFGGNRHKRIEAARDIDERLAHERVKESAAFKVGAQDSDVLDSLVMTKSQASADKRRLRRQIDSDRAAIASGALSTEDHQAAQNRILANERKLTAHSHADAIGRTTASRQAAFLNGDRIKFTSNNHAQEMELARDIFGEEGAASAMNEHQAIAKSPNVGRSDLSASLYGQPADLDRATDQTSMYELLNYGRPAAIESLANQHIDRINDPGASREEKQRSAAWLHALQQSKGQGKTSSQNTINNLSGGISSAINNHVQDEAARRMATESVPVATKRPVERSTTDPVTGETVTRSDSEYVTLTPEERQMRAIADARREMEQRAGTYRAPSIDAREAERREREEGE